MSRGVYVWKGLCPEELLSMELCLRGFCPEGGYVLDSLIMLVRQDHCGTEGEKHWSISQTL